MNSIKPEKMECEFQTNVLEFPTYSPDLELSEFYFLSLKNNLAEY